MNSTLKKGIFKDTLLVSILSIFSQGVGFLMIIFVVRIYGVTNVTDAYYLALSFSDLIISIIIGGAMRLVLLPILIELKNSENYSEFLGQILLILVLFSLLMVAIALMVFESSLFSESISGEFKYIYWLLLILVPINIFFNYFNTIYTSEQKFGLFEVANTIRILTVLGFILFLNKSLGIYALVFGQLVGSSIALLVTIYKVNKTVKPRFIFKLRVHESIKQTFNLVAYGVAAFVLARFTPFVAKMLSAILGEGDVTIYSVSEKAIAIPSLLIGSTFTTVLTSHWMKLKTEQKNDEVIKTFNNTLSIITMLTVPITTGLFFLRENFVVLIYSDNTFSEQTIKDAALAFGILAITIVPNYVHSVAIRILHINKSLKLNFILALVGFLTSSFLMYILAVEFKLGLTGLVTGLLISNTLISATTLLYVKKHFIKLNVKYLLTNNVKVVLSTAVMWLMLHMLNKIITFTSSFLHVLVFSLVGILVYFCMNFLLKNSDLMELKKINRK
ncbi:lipid II flippase MurJ [Ekhidna sp.]